MASSQTFLAPKIPVQLQQQPQGNKVIMITPELIQQIKKKLEEMGPGPFTPEQQKQRDSYMKYINLENQAQNVIFIYCFRNFFLRLIKNKIKNLGPVCFSTATTTATAAAATTTTAGPSSTTTATTTATITNLKRSNKQC